MNLIQPTNHYCLSQISYGSTGWDICATVGEISTGGSENPSDEHVRTTQKTVNYLWSTVDLCLRLGGLGKLSLFCFSDASYITEGNSKSRLGDVWP